MDVLMKSVVLRRSIWWLILIIYAVSLVALDRRLTDQNLQISSLRADVKLAKDRILKLEMVILK